MSGLPGGDMPVVPNDPTVLPLTGPSAFVGQPPNTQADYYIIKGLYRLAHMEQMNPMMGYLFAAKPPPGYKHETLVPGIYAGLSIVCAAIILPTAARIWLRMRAISGMVFGWDDWMILLASLVALIWPAAQMYSLTAGSGGIHIWEVTYDRYDSGMVIAALSKTVFYVAVSLIKLSIAIFIRRMADRLNRWWRIACDAFIASIVAFGIASLFYVVFTCDPPRVQWSLYERGVLETTPVCLDAVLQSRVLSGIHVAQGLMLLSTPMFILWKVRMNKAKKIRLFCMWIVGGLTVTGGLLKQIRPASFADFTWDYTEVVIWTCLDLCLGILVASLPVMDAAFERGWQKARTAIGGTSAGSRQGTSRKWQYGQASDLEHSRSHNTKVTASTHVKERSESSESIFRLDDNNHGNAFQRSGNMEMKIMKSQEVEVKVTERPPDSYHEEFGWDKIRR